MKLRHIEWFGITKERKIKFNKIIKMAKGLNTNAKKIFFDGRRIRKYKR